MKHLHTLALRLALFALWLIQPFVLFAAAPVNGTMGFDQFNGIAWRPQQIAPAAGNPVISGGTAAPYTSPAMFFAPANQAGIVAAAVAANAAGGGVVKIPAGVITLTSAITLLPGVVFEGTSSSRDATNPSSTPPGTVLRGDGTFPCFQYHPTDNVDPTSAGNPTPFQNCLFGAGIANLTVDTFTYGVKIGALNQSGASPLNIRNVWATHCTQWGFWLENCALGSVSDCYGGNNIAGNFYFGCSTPAWNFGNYSISGCGGQTATVGGINSSRNFCINSRNACSLNMLTLSDIEAVGPTGNTNHSETATMVGTVAAITVTNLQYFQPGVPVVFSTTVGNITGNIVYFVATASGATGAGTITISKTLFGIGGDLVTPSTSGTPTINTRGPTNLEIAGTQGGNVTNITLVSCDLEQGGTAELLLQNGNNCNLSPTLLSNDSTFEFAFVARINSTGGTTAPSNRVMIMVPTSVIDLDGNSQHMRVDGYRPVTYSQNLAGVGMVWNNSLARSEWYGAGYGVIPAYTQDSSNISRPGGQLSFIASNINTGGNLANVANGNVYMYNTGSAGSITLPTISATNTGTVFFICNPQAFTLTVNTSSSQVVNGAAGVTSFTVAANSCAVVIAAASISGFSWYVK